MLGEAEGHLHQEREPMDFVTQTGQAERLGVFDAVWDLFRGKEKCEVLREAWKG